MPREEPFFRKCCYCIPLQSCLQLWSGVKSVADISLAVILSLVVMLLSSCCYHELSADHFTVAHLCLIIIVVLVVDSVFMLVLSVGLCTNNIRTLRVFLYYSIYMMFMGGACVIGFAIYALSEVVNSSREELLVIFIVGGLINSALDVCMFFTLKSEIIKLRNKQQYEFVQMPTLDAEDHESRGPAEPFQADDENINA